MNGVQGTLIELLVSQLDVSVRNKEGDEIDKGCVECFLDIIKHLLPYRFNEVRKKAEKAAPIEVKETKAERLSMNHKALENVFNAIKENDESTSTTKQAIETFKMIIQNKKKSLMNEQGYLRDNRYYLDLIHLIYGAFAILSLARN
jgi:hypothetical protein